MSNDNSVELIGYYGDDEIIACSAWTSTSRKLDEKKRQRIPQLIDMLWSEGHHTPFEKGIVHFLVNTDIATHIHLLKHRISSVNSECLEKSTLISFENINGKVCTRISVEELYKKFTEGRKHQKTKKDAEYSKKRIKSMRIRVLNEDTGVFESSNIKDIWKTGVKNIYKIRLRNGKELMCSENHPIYTKDGYKSINTGLSVGDMAGCNGVSINMEGRPWTFKEFFTDAEAYTRKDFANKKGISYELCKKWGYIFDIEFKEDQNKNFKKGNQPWNSGKAGTYSLNISEAGRIERAKVVKRGSESHFWRGGLSKDREKIGAWTTRNAKDVHKKYSYTCQKCGNNKQDLVAHHIIPVCQDESKAMDFNNLITVCSTCHKAIHKDIISEREFASQVLSNEFVPFAYDKRLNRKVNNLKHVHFSDIVSIEYVKSEECYDIEVEGKWKNFVANGIVTHNSARYKELKEDKYYLPSDWTATLSEDFYWGDDKIPFIQKDTPWINILEDVSRFTNALYHAAIKDIAATSDRKRAKESARFFKLYNSQIQADVMFNMRSFANFIKLRYSEHAQVEIRELAKKMLDLVINEDGGPFKHTIAAWKKAGVFNE